MRMLPGPVAPTTVSRGPPGLKGCLAWASCQAAAAYRAGSASKSGPQAAQQSQYRLPS